MRVHSSEVEVLQVLERVRGCGRGAVPRRRRRRPGVARVAAAESASLHLLRLELLLLLEVLKFTSPISFQLLSLQAATDALDLLRLRLVGVVLVKLGLNLVLAVRVKGCRLGQL